MKEKKWELSDILLIVFVTGLSFVMRYVVKHVVTPDWTIYWQLWFDELYKDGFKALAGNWYDYAPPFVYLMYIITKLPINCMTGYKVMTSLFDLGGAIMAYKIIWQITGNRMKSVITYAIFIICPLFIVNSTLWAQCDMIPMFWVLLCLYFFIKEKPNLAMCFFGVAFAFKLQPLWLAPLLVILWVNKRVDFKHFLWLPFWYFIGILPAWIAGRPLFELLTIYTAQSSADMFDLALKYCNVYYLIGTNAFLDEYYAAGVWLTLGILMCVLYYIGRKNLKMTPKFILLLGGFIGILAPYFLPHMHERYAFFGEVMLMLYVILEPKRFYLPVFQILVSFMGYSVFLARDWSLPLEKMPFIALAAVIGVGYEVYKYVNNPENQESQEALEVKSSC